MIVRWLSRGVSSPSPEYPELTAMFEVLLDRLLHKEGPGSWIHLDGRTDRGWVRDVFLGKGPWLEIAYRDEESVLLNFGRRAEHEVPAIPTSWRQEGKGIRIVPLHERRELIGWICKYFLVLGGASGRYSVKGCIDG